MKKYVILSSFLLLLFGEVYAQSGLTFSPTVGFTKGEFRDQAPDLKLWGFHLNGLYQIPQTPIHVGAEFGYQMYGTKLTRDLDLFANGDRLRNRRNNNVLQMSGLVRIKPQIDFPVKPYLDGLIGYQYFYTRSTLRPGLFEEPLDHYTEVSDWSFHKAYGGGLQFELKDLDALIDLRLIVFDTQRTNYLLRGDAFFDPVDNVNVYNTRQSKVDTFMLSLGFHVLLD